MDQLNSTLNDGHLVSLIDSASDINFNLQSTFLRGENYRNLKEQTTELDSIIDLTTKLDECIHEPTRFNEAVELFEMIEYLHRKHGTQLSIIESIHKQSERRREYFIASLCNRLEQLKAPSREELVSIVNYLIRCGNFSDRDLRLKYLQARDNWFNNSCEEKSSSFDDVLSVHCSGLPMIFNEYKSIFSLDSSEILDWKLTKLSSNDPTKEDGAIINSWLLLKASIFIASLKIYLKTINQSRNQTPTMLGDTMQKCFELTGSLASIGFDFSSRLSPLFSEALANEVVSSIERATEKFESSFASIVSKSIESLLLPVEDEILRISNMRSEEQLPKSIEHYPIYRIYCLRLIDSLRWLQATKNTLSPISLCIDTYAALNSSLTRITKALSAVLNMDNNFNHPMLNKIAISFITEVIPFITNYCERLFPERVILNAIGLSKSEFKNLFANEPEKLKNFRIDLRQIVDPLKSTMPALVETIEV